jgi:hypothetical protein
VDNFSSEGLTALIIYTSLSLIMMVLVLITRLFNTKAKVFSKKVFTYWKPALIIVIIYFISASIGSGLSAVNLIWSVGLFCQTLIGLSIAYSIDGFQPFPIAANSSLKGKFIRSCLLMIAIAIIASIAVMLTSGISAGIGHIFGESSSTDSVTSLLPKNGIKALFALLAGAGIIEGVTYRLIVLSLAMRLTKKRLPAILLAAVVFAIYHFTPLNMMYKIYWQIPVTQLVNVMFGAIIIGFIYTKRGFGTSVLSHTLADGLPLLAYIYILN